MQSRYYDSAVGRFINVDGYASTGQGIVGNNMFVYCNNNPINMSDSSGQIPTTLLIITGIALTGIINNTINAVLYEQADGVSDLTSSSYQEKKPTRKEKLDFVKQETGDEHFSINAWRYYSEYSIHEYGWYVTKWADKKDVPLFSEMAYHFSVADVDPQKWDHWSVSIPTVIWGLSGF